MEHFDAFLSKRKYLEVTVEAYGHALSLKVDEWKARWNSGLNLFEIEDILKRYKNANTDQSMANSDH